jgi:hypothetical protein
MGRHRRSSTTTGCRKIDAIRVGLNARFAAAEILALIRDCQPTVRAYTAGQQRTIDLIKPDIEALKVPPVLIGFGGSHSAPNDYDELIRKFAAKGRLEQTPHHTGEC